MGEAVREALRGLVAAVEAAKVEWDKPMSDESGLSFLNRWTDEVMPALIAAQAALGAGEPKTLGDAVKLARAKWYEDHGGKDTIQVLVENLERDNTDLHARLAAVESERERYKACYEGLCQSDAEVRDRLARYEEKDGQRTREHNLLVKENRELRARLAACEGEKKEKR